MYIKTAKEGGELMDLRGMSHCLCLILEGRHVGGLCRAGLVLVLPSDWPTDCPPQALRILQLQEDLRSS